MINYYRFCCRIRIADAGAEEVPGGEFLATEDGEARYARERFADARLSEFSDWYRETPALVAHIRALATGRTGLLESRLVDTEAARVFARRSRQDLYALAARGRLTRYTRRRGAQNRTFWDVLELETVRRTTTS